MKQNVADLHVAVDNTYPNKGYMHLREVRDATGFDAVRTADHIAIGMYRSVGRLIHGFEMKVSRSDWLKELSMPHKSESLLRYCHHWSLITPTDADIVRDDLPTGWGHGVPFQLRANVAPRIKWLVKPALRTPEPLNIVFVTALLYAATNGPRTEFNEMLAKARIEGRTSRDYEMKNYETRISHMQTLIDAVEQHTGMKFNEYTSPEMVSLQAEQFREWRKLSHASSEHRDDLERLLEQSRRITRGIEKTLQK